MTTATKPTTTHIFYWDQDKQKIRKSATDSPRLEWSWPHAVPIAVALYDRTPTSPSQRLVAKHDRWSKTAPFSYGYYGETPTACANNANAYTLKVIAERREEMHLLQHKIDQLIAGLVTV